MKLPAVYAILDGKVLAQRGLDLTVAAGALLEGGVKLLQLRWKEQYTREVYNQAAGIAELCQQARAQFVVDDRADIALLLDAGVHTGQDDLSPLDVRRVVGADAFVGVSTHNRHQFDEAARQPVSYIAVGPMYGTVSKDDPDPVVGISELARLRTRYDGPLVAIGGITRERAPEVWQAGADSVAIIGDLYPEFATEASIRNRAEEWMRLANEQSPRYSG